MRSSSALLTPCTYLQMLWAITYGYLVFGQLPDGMSVLGMAVIVASGIALAWHERPRTPVQAPVVEDPEPDVPIP